jgi:exopolyphosphatase/guanosine-5'-triphosphate,3'-diphosphate pyrophosphatase
MKHESRQRDGGVLRGERLAVIGPGADLKTTMTGEAYAALDLGTNNCRLLIASPAGDSFRVVDSFSRIVRLGEGISQTGRMSDAAMERALAALRVCRDKMVAREVSRTRLIATEACRAAANADAFCERVHDELGIRLEVIDRQTEAMLAVTGCLPLLDSQATGAILFDIGGGSTELVRLDRPVAGTMPTIEGWVSLPLGVVTLAESHGGTTVTPQSYADMVTEVAARLAPFAREHGGNLEGMHLLGTSGTVTTVAGIYLNLARYDRRRVDGIWMSDADVTRTVQRLLGMSYEERIGNGCIGTDRGDLVLAGCAILDAIRQAFPCPRLRIADRGLREGMLVQMMREDGAIASTCVSELAAAT